MKRVFIFGILLLYIGTSPVLGQGFLPGNERNILTPTTEETNSPEADTDASTESEESTTAENQEESEQAETEESEEPAQAATEKSTISRLLSVFTTDSTDDTEQADHSDASTDMATADAMASTDASGDISDMIFADASADTRPLHPSEVIHTPDEIPERKERTVKVISPKRVILFPGTVQRVKTGKDGESILNVEFEKMDPEKSFPIVKIQGIPFNLTERSKKIEFTWQKANYQLVWLQKGVRVLLASTEPFGERTFSPKAEKVKTAPIEKGMEIRTKRRNGAKSELVVTGITRDVDGKMVKFSLKTYNNVLRKYHYQTDNNIPAPLPGDQYEKGVNGEVLFIFKTDENGQIHIYYK